MKGQPEQVWFQQKDNAWYVKLWYSARHPFTAAIFPALSWTEEAALQAAAGVAQAYGCTQWCASSQTWSQA